MPEWKHIPVHVAMETHVNNTSVTHNIMVMCVKLNLKCKLYIKHNFMNFELLIHDIERFFVNRVYGMV